MRHTFLCPALLLIVTTFAANLSAQKIETATQAARAAGSLRQLAELTASDSGGAVDAFGWAIAMSGNTVVVGAPFAHSGAGAAYVFVMPASG